MKTFIRSSTKKVNENLEYFLENGIDVLGRNVNIFSDITPEVARDVIMGLQRMMQLSSDKPINIYINSEGGEIYSGLAIYDYIRSLGTVEVTTHLTGCAMSMGSIIFLSGDVKYAYENSTMMLHCPSSESSGKVFAEMEDPTTEVKRLYKVLCRIYEKHSCKPYKYWYDNLKYRDKYLDTVQILELGFAKQK